MVTASSEPVIEKSSSKKNNQSIVRKGIVWLIAIVCLVWIFYDIHIELLWSQIKLIQWWLVLIAIFFDCLSYYSQGIRWALLLSAQGELSFLRSTQAIYAGLFTNEIFPLRPGEIVRSYLVSRWIGNSVISILPTLAVERLFDAFWLALAIGISASVIPLPSNLIRAGDILGIIVVIASVLFIFLILRKPHESRNMHVPAIIKIVQAIISKFAEEIHRIGITKKMFLSLFISSFILLFQAISFWFVMKAYNIHISLFAGAIVFFIVHLGTAIPNAPSNIGSFQLFTVLGLSLFGIDKTTAAGFSVVVFIVLTLPLWVLGLFAIITSHVTLKTIQKETMQLINKLAPQN